MSPEALAKRAEAVELYDHGCTWYAIERLTGLTVGQIRYALKLAGRKPRRARWWDEARRLHVEQRLTPERIQKLLGHQHQVVRHALKAMGCYERLGARGRQQEAA